ncbi:MAG: chemotaxis protein CheW [Armatimonadetes bacterium]|nr:chemotaxis protein CheW [Armatimonadota bacterium]
MSNEVLENTADESEQLVVFELAKEYYGVDIAAVNTIIRMQEVTEIPRTPDFVEGVINLRGSIVPVIDLRKRFGLTVSEATKSSRIVVVEAGGQMIGMVVDAVAETLRLPADAIEPPSPVITSVDSDYLRGVGKQDNRLFILLDLDKVLTAREIESLGKIEKRARKEAEEPAAQAA